jgi:hypothetical protein
VQRNFSTTKQLPSSGQKSDTPKQSFVSQHPRERQLRYFYRANNLCFYYKEAYDPTHPAKCTKILKAQANALVINELDIELTKEVLNQLAMEDAMIVDFCSLYLNAIAGTDNGNV